VLLKLILFKLGALTVKGFMNQGMKESMD